MMRLSTFTATLVILAAAAAEPRLADLTVSSPPTRTELRYPVTVIRGTADSGRMVRIENAALEGDDSVACAAIVAGQFVALVRLAPGRNSLHISAGGDEKEWLLHYRPATTDHRVRVVYLTGSEGNTAYPTQLPADPQDFADRLRAAAELMQTFTAEAMEGLGHGRLTFSLERSDDGRVVVDTVALPETAEELRSRDPADQWQRTHAFLSSRYDLERTKILAMNAFVAYDPASGRMVGHTALGGGALAVFSTNSLYAWPRDLGDVERAFGDTAPVDTSFVVDDTAGRGTLWAMAATGIGAWLHELGHTFGLPHSADSRAIMSRGFDLFNRTFCIEEPPCGRHAEPLVFDEGQTAYWDPFFADRLAISPWLQPDGPKATDLPGPEITFDWDSDTLLLRAPAGLALTQAESSDGHVIDLMDLGDPHGTSMTMDRTALLAEAGNAEARVLVFDICGRSASVECASLKRPEWFISKWRFARKARDWTPPTAPALSEEEVRELVADLRSQPLTEHRPTAASGQFSADLSELYGMRGNAVAYAFCEFEADSASAAKLSCGGDDGLRAWLNGELVLDASGLHVGPPDHWQADVSVREGINTLLVETQQGPGGWLMSVRLTLPTGTPLVIGDGGHLIALGADL